MTLYLDVIWFLNLCIDYLLIALTAIALKRKFLHVRFILAALFASLIIFLMFTPIGSLFYQPWMKLIYSILIVLIAFGFKRWKYFLQSFFMFYFVTFMTGGGLFALHYFWRTEIDLLEAVSSPAAAGYGSGISWVFVVIGFPLVWFFSKHRIETMEVKRIEYQQLATVQICIDGHLIRTDGLIDSGNKLHDPITKAPVMILEASCLYDAFGQDCIQQLLNLTMTTDDENDVTDELLKRTKVIPYKVIGQSTPFLTALKPDYVIVKHGGHEFKTKHVLVGLQDQELSPEQAYRSIIHPSLVLGPSVSTIAN
ncbi:sigma-E processing peptidase SpoIIGA [Bacillus sp. FJAT-45037]|uniref:sigma-E processing peptidase SpoIIGA n=1 Tax=Bacillus sp. FJAT-45037 TaxID=2011007 RepID=UPI000C24FD55|nr:sigma-E processing peptidase SpoIIGA [Bacillus sp. FJAT-45037]